MMLSLLGSVGIERGTGVSPVDMHTSRAGRPCHALTGAILVLALLVPAIVFGDSQTAAGQEWHPGTFGYIDRNYSEFAPFETTTVRVGDSHLDVYISSASTIDRAMVLGWINKAATALSNYYGHFPVPRVDIVLIPNGRRGIHYGQTLGGRIIRVEYGQQTTQRSFDNDWILTHEMFHTAFPDIDPQHLWMVEGQAVYLEPLARARVGNLTPEQVWRGVVREMPNGLPEAGDAGLDSSSSWGATYWGGTLFWLEADIQIRQQTNNKKSVDDAMRAILAAGGTGSVTWPVERVIRVADKATGTHVVRDLYDQMALHRADTDLNALWKSLGISADRWQTTFDDTAPLAGIREAMTARVARATSP
jgi:hypothetical protein